MRALLRVRSGTCSISIRLLEKLSLAVSHLGPWPLTPSPLLCFALSTTFQAKAGKPLFSVRSNDFGWMQTRGGPPCDADPTDGGARLQVRPSPSPYRASTLQQQQQYLRLQFLPPQQRWVLLSNGPLFICSPLRRFEGPEWNSVVRERN